MSLPISKVAACHIAPVFLDKAATLEKAAKWIVEAHENGADLVVFPEVFVPAFPIWSAAKAPIDNHHLFQKLCEESLYVDGPEIQKIQEICKDLKILVCLGFNEKSHASVGCLWNSFVLINDDGTILSHHRKLVPTFYEKLTWAYGDGSGIQAVDTRIGKVGGLICGENTNSLAKFTLNAEGENIHIALWPPAWPTRRPGDGAQFDGITANKIRTASQCFEAKCYGILCSGFIDQAMKDFLIADDPSNREVYENLAQSATMFLDPTGNEIGDKLVDKEGIAYATFDLNKCVELKQLHDTAGYYNRFDVFQLHVNKSQNVPIHYFNPQVGTNVSLKTVGEPDSN